MVTYTEVLPIWWSVTWRGFLAGALAGFVLGGIVGFIAYAIGQPEAGGQWGGIAGTLSAIPVSLWALRAAINKHQLRIG